MASPNTIELRKRQEILDPKLRWKLCHWVKLPSGSMGWAPVARARVQKVTPPDKLAFQPHIGMVANASQRALGTYVPHKPSGVPPMSKEDRRKARNARKAERRALRG